MVKTIVRLTDHVVSEYELGRKRILEFAAPGQEGNPQTTTANIGGGIVAACNFETCLISLRRIVAHVKGLRDDPSAREELKTLLPNSAAYHSVGKIVVDVRNEIAHVERELLNGTLPDKAPFGLFPTPDAGLQIGKYSLTYQQLAGFVTEIHASSKLLIDYTEEKPSAPSAS